MKSKIMDVSTIAVLSVINTAGVIEVLNYWGLVAFVSDWLAGGFLVFALFVLMSLYPLWLVASKARSFFGSPSLYLGFSSLVLGFMALFHIESDLWLSAMAKLLLGGVLLLLNWEHKHRGITELYVQDRF